MDGKKLRYDILLKTRIYRNQKGEIITDYIRTEKRFYNKKKLFEFLNKNGNKFSYVRCYY